MSKRFTCTDKWKKRFIKTLEAPYKLLWLYILDDCDHAGIWHTDFEVAAIRIGEDVTEEIALKVFADKIVQIDGGEKWFIPSFVEFQYGELNPNNRAHNSVISILGKYNLLNRNKPLTSPLQGAKDMDMDKDKDKVKDKDKEVKTKFSEFVRMTQAQYDKLVCDHGVDGAKSLIDRLDNYKGSKGKTYKCDYRAILSWVVDDLKSKTNENKKGTTRGRGYHTGKQDYTKQL